MKPQLFVPGEQGPWQETGPGVKRRLRAYNADIMAVEVAFEKGAQGAPHSHPHHQVTYCLSGSFRFEVEGQAYDLNPGDSLVFPSGALHGCTALAKGVLLDIFSPARLDFLEA